MGELSGCGPLHRYHFSHKQGTLFLTLALALKGSAVVPLSVYLLHRGLSLLGIRFILGVNDSFQPLTSPQGMNTLPWWKLGNCFGLINTSFCCLVLCCPWAPSYARARLHPHEAPGQPF